MSGTYICCREADPKGMWAVVLVGNDGRRHQVFSCERYLDAARLVRELRSTG